MVHIVASVDCLFCPELLHLEISYHEVGGGSGCRATHLAWQGGRVGRVFELTAKLVLRSHSQPQPCSGHLNRFWSAK